MSQSVTPADFGKPNLKAAGFQLWVHGRQFPEHRAFSFSMLLSVSILLNTNLWVSSNVRLQLICKDEGSLCVDHRRKGDGSCGERKEEA